MVKDLFRRYIWLVDTVFRAGRLTFEEINGRWKRTEMSGGEDLPQKTFHNHRQAIADIFGIDIECSKRGGYYYYISNADDIEEGGVRAWLLNTFAVNNLINESHHLKHRILFEEIPSGQKFLAPVIEAMKEGVRIEVTYRSFGRESAFTVEVEPYCVKVFRQRWYMLAHSPGAGGLCIYSLDRVEGLSLTENKFDLPENFDAESYFHDSFGIIVYAGSPAEIVRLRVYGGKRDYFRTLPLHHSQKEVGIYEEYSIFEYSYPRPLISNRKSCRMEMRWRCFRRSISVRKSGLLSEQWRTITEQLSAVHRKICRYRTFFRKKFAWRIKNYAYIRYQVCKV